MSFPGAGRANRSLRPKNIGGRIAPPPSPRLIEPQGRSVNGRADPAGRFGCGQSASLRLNSPLAPAKPGNGDGKPNFGVRMIRGFFRLVGLLLLTGGFIFLVYDGARSVADGTVQWTRLGDFWNDVHQSSQQAVRLWAEQTAPWVWTNVLKLLLAQPTFAVLGVLGILLMLLFRPRKPLIGYARD